MSRQPEVYVQDIAEAIEKIERYRERVGEPLGKDDMQTDAIIRNLEVIGEAVKQLPDDTKQDCPEIEWRKIAGLRDILIHTYFGVNIEILEDVIGNRLPELEKCIETLSDKDM